MNEDVWILLKMVIFQCHVSELGSVFLVSLPTFRVDMSWLSWCARSSAKVLTWWRWGRMGGGDTLERLKRVMYLSRTSLLSGHFVKSHNKRNLDPLYSCCVSRKANTFLKFTEIWHRAKPDFTPDGWIFFASPPSNLSRVANGSSRIWMSMINLPGSTVL